MNCLSCFGGGKRQRGGPRQINAPGTPERRSQASTPRASSPRASTPRASTPQASDQARQPERSHDQGSTSRASGSNAPPTERGESSAARDENQLYVFTYLELAAATENFNNQNLIGEGGFGRVYRGHIERIDKVVAIKKLNSYSVQGEQEFLAETSMLKIYRHPNIIQMLGSCAEGRERAIVYEYMPRGSLDQVMHDDQIQLNWRTRLSIALDVASGIRYLHKEASRRAILRDIKPANILLDDEFHAKLSDFGLAKFAPEGDSGYISTGVMGTLGYCAPEYVSSGTLTAKSDIFGFGVVLLELITGGKPVDYSRQSNRQHLVDWVKGTLADNNRNYASLVDNRVAGQCTPMSLELALSMACLCVLENPDNRPPIDDVVRELTGAVNDVVRELSGAASI